MTTTTLEYAMSHKHVSAALVVIGIAVFAAVAYDATLIADALGAPAQGGEGVVAMAGLGIAFAAVAFGLRGLWPKQVRARKWGQSEVSRSEIRT